MLNFIIGFVVGGGVVYFIMLIMRKSAETQVAPKRDIVVEAKEKHAETMAKVEDYIKNKTEITNDEIQSFLGVSDASAERYLQELESQGKLKQIGTVGLQVKYQVL